MNIDAERLELINWISNLKDHQLIRKLILLKTNTEETAKTKRKAGDGKYLIKYIADDFNDPIGHFDEYKP